MRACYRREFHVFAAFLLLSQAESAHRDSRSMKRETCHMLGGCLPIYVEAARVVVHVHMSLQRHGTLVSVGVCVVVSCMCLLCARVHLLQQETHSHYHYYHSEHDPLQYAFD